MLKVLRNIAGSWRYGSEVVVKAAKDGGWTTFKSVARVLERQLTREQVSAFSLSSHPY